MNKALIIVVVLILLVIAYYVYHKDVSVVDNFVFTKKYGLRGQ